MNFLSILIYIHLFLYLSLLKLNFLHLKALIFINSFSDNLITTQHNKLTSSISTHPFLLRNKHHTFLLQQLLKKTNKLTIPTKRWSNKIRMIIYLNNRLCQDNILYSLYISLLYCKLSLKFYKRCQLCQQDMVLFYFRIGG